MISAKVFSEDTWLANVIGRPAFRVSGTQNLNLASLPKKAFVYCKISVRNTSEIHALETVGFQLVDTHISFEAAAQDIKKYEIEKKIRMATESDEHQAVTLAKNTFLFSRFHLDSQFSTETADKVKSEWMQNYFRGRRGDQLIVAEENNKLVGYLLMIDLANGNWVIDLIGVDSDQRGRGIAAKMISYSIQSCKNLQNLSVGTQVANRPSIRLYEKMGFRYNDAHYVFHYHNL